MEYMKDGIPFLDILIKDSIQTWIDIYYKSTDTHRFLSFSSNCPKHCKNNITFVRQICTIIENTEAKIKRVENL